jgi:HK97 family phage prohead protease
LFARRELPVQPHYGALLRIEEVKASDSGWEVAGYASTFGNVDHGGDIVEQGAFFDSIAQWKSGQKKIRFLFSHRADQVLGVPLELREDSKGLFARAKISQTSLGSDVHTLLKDGAVDSFSIGYVPESFEFDEGGNVRRLKQVDLLEWSVVAIPMNDMAGVTNVKVRTDVPFDALLDQITDHLRNLTTGAEAAEALHARRASEQRKLSDAHVDAISKFLVQAKAASERLERLIEEPEAEAEGDLHLRMELTRRLLARRGLIVEAA